MIPPSPYNKEVSSARANGPTFNDEKIFDVAIAGAGIIGLSLALELRGRGYSVVVLERGRAMQGASWSAGGMLAAHDPENPPALLPLSLHSLEMYPEYLQRIQHLSGQRIPLRTRRTLQRVDDEAEIKYGHEPATLAEMQAMAPGIAVDAARKFFWLEEDSLDPRDICRALPMAARAAGVTLLEDSAVVGIQREKDSVGIVTGGGALQAQRFVNACGAWSSETWADELSAATVPAPVVPAPPVAPAKGQMVNVALAAERLRCVLRVPGMYLIPRGDGRVTIGATIEYIGFDTTVHKEKMRALIAQAAMLLPELRECIALESWIGFRPATPDGLPILGPWESGSDGNARCWLATGHFRNGILLAPVTARCLAQAMFGERPEVALEKFSPRRFAANEAFGQTVATETLRAG